MFEYYFTILSDHETGTMHTGVCYKLDYKLDSFENMVKFCEFLKNEGYENPVILFFKQLNE